jgi:hypothetical protein
VLFLAHQVNDQRRYPDNEGRPEARPLGSHQPRVLAIHGPGSETKSRCNRPPGATEIRSASPLDDQPVDVAEVVEALQPGRGVSPGAALTSIKRPSIREAGDRPADLA